MTRRADDGVDDGQSDKKIVIVFESDFDFGQERDSRSHMRVVASLPTVMRESVRGRMLHLLGRDKAL